VSHIEDRWWKEVPDPTTKSGVRREKKTGYGKGMRYRVRWTPPGATEQSESFPDGQKRAAENFKKEIDLSMLAGTYVDPRAGDMPFKALAEDWIKGTSNDPSSRETVANQVYGHIVPFFAQRRPTVAGACTEDAVKDWLAWLSRSGLELSTQSQMFDKLTSIMDAAVRARIVPENPCKSRGITRPKPTQKKIIPWTQTRVNTIWQALPERNRIVVPLGAALGLRIGEICGLSPHDFRRRDGVVDIQRQARRLNGGTVFSPPKGGKSRVVPVSKDVLSDLDDYLDMFKPVEMTLPWRTLDGRKETVELLMPRDSGEAFYGYLFNATAWKSAFKKSGLTRRRLVDGPHALRHYYASMMLESGVSINDLAEYLGHHNASVTLRYYAHMMPSSHDRARAAVDLALKSIRAAAEESVAEPEEGAA
jgi:integrase